MATKINKTTGDRWQDEDWRRIYDLNTKLEARVSALESGVAAPSTTTPPNITPLPPVIPGSAGTTVNPVEATSVVGILPSWSASDHAHAGLHSISVSSIGFNPDITGDATLSTGGGINLLQAGQNIQISALIGTIPPTKITHASSPYAMGGSEFIVFADTSAGAITINMPAPAATNGRFLIIMNMGAPGNTVTVVATVGSMVGITSLVNVSGKTAVWYISDGTNWYSFTNSAGN